MTEAIFIYQLSDPITLECRYIGKTKNPKNRYSGHICKAINSKGRMYKSQAWIASLLKIGVKPKMDILEECLESEWREKEQYWIAKCKQEGSNITNLTDGGDGLTGASEETRKLIGLASKGRIPSKEARERMSIAQKGKKKPEGFSERLSERNRMAVFSYERKSKIGNAQKGKILSDEHRQAISKANKGIKQSEDHVRKRADHAINRNIMLENEAISLVKTGLGMKELYERGFSYRMIGRIFNIHHCNVKNEVNK